MEQISKSTNWGETDLLESTADPSISVAEIDNEIPKLTVAAIVGVTVVVLLAIAAVFLLGVLIDWRQQRMLEKKMGEVKRMKHHRRVNTHPDSDDVSIANHMEESGLSLPPAEILRNVP